MAIVQSLPRSRPVISSLGFSGAGFLTCYHLGVAQCLVDHGVINLSDDVDRPASTAPSGRADTDDKGTMTNQTQSSFSTSMQSPQPIIPLCGVSGGALTAAALAAHVAPRDGMEAVLQVAQRARKAGRLNVLQPGFSLIDVMEDYLRPLLKSADINAFMRRIEHGKRLRIGLTDTRRLRSLGREHSFVYVDSYADMDDVMAACVLSSYVPGVTGPAWGSLDANNSAVSRAMRRLEDMLDRGCVKDGTDHKLVQRDVADKTAREFCWDGGIANCFPYFDDNTVMVTPLAVDFPSHLSINPSVDRKYRDSYKSMRYLSLTPHVRLHLTPSNGLTWKQILWSPTDDELQRRFDQGYENAETFLEMEEAVVDDSGEAAKAAAASGTTATGLF
ncbi:patatin-like phospholipase domain-containing protein 2 [Mayamaea pseudoterrestris]|nr:patatin-like phospholipase domain-containing protein 2 [Mayamaea pseudoterrestris]